MIIPTFVQQDSRTPRAFTLIELLVTVTIILILAALSLAGFSKMRAGADQVVATRNMSQLMVANASYAADHNGKYVPWMVTDEFSKTQNGAAYWANNWEFLRNLRGPEKTNHEGEATLSVLDPITARAKKDSYMVLYTNYGYNITHMPGMGTGAWPGKSANGSFSINQVTNPSLAACFITGTDLRVGPEKPLLWRTPANQKEGKTANGMTSFRHANKTKALVVYYDGHVSAMTMGDMDKIYEAGAKETPFWNAGYPNIFGP